MDLVEAVKAKALELGFDVAGIASAVPIEPQWVEHYRRWLQAGYAAQMGYLRRNMETRMNPGSLLDGARSVIVVGLGYKPALVADVFCGRVRPFGRVAQYAQYRDYHVVIKDLLRQLASFIARSVQTQMRFKICVDSAPVAERALALRAGLGFIGKNHMLVSPELGPQILLGEVVTTMELTPDTRVDLGCGDCDRCIRACPTGALRPDGWFDANRCISYLTIEHKGAIPAELAEQIGDRVFGCDECVLACPWAQKAPSCAKKDLKWYPERQKLNLRDVLAMKQEQFEIGFADSPIRRTGLRLLQRNARICLNNLS